MKRKINLAKKLMYGMSQIFPVGVEEITATDTGATIVGNHGIVEVTGVTGQTTYKVVLPDPSTIGGNKRFNIVGVDFASKLAVAGSSKTINGIDGEGTIDVGVTYVIRKVDGDGYTAIGMTVA